MMKSIGQNGNVLEVERRKLRVKTNNLLFQILKTKFRFKKIRVNIDVVVFVGVASFFYFMLCILAPVITSLEDPIKFPFASLFKAMNMFFFASIGVLIGIILIKYLLRRLFSVVFEVD